MCQFVTFFIVTCQYLRVERSLARMLQQTIVSATLKSPSPYGHNAVGRLFIKLNSGTAVPDLKTFKIIS